MNGVGLALILNCGSCDAHFSQMKKRIGVEGFRIIDARLRRKALRLRRSQPRSATDLVQAACIG